MNHRHLLAAAAATIALLGVRTASAIDCSTLPNPVFIQNGDTQEPLMKQLGKALRESTVNPITIVYRNSGSCTNIEAMYSGTKLTVNPSYVPSAAEDPTWDPSKPSPQCTIAPGGEDLDLAISALFVTACNPDPAPAGLAVFTGPVQPYLFVVPQASSQEAIWAEEAYFTFGFGNSGTANPWTDESFFHIRTATKSTLLTIAANITVPAVKMKGIPWDKSSEVMAAVSASPEPDKTIGLLGAELYDQNRDALNALAFKAFGQRHAYYPDSTRESFDKQNVRDGHYTIWSPTEYIAKVDGQGDIVDPDVAYIVGLILGSGVDPEPDFEPLDILVGGVKLVPDCAMKVKRGGEGADLSPYDPAEPCHCYFEATLGTPSASCTECEDDSPCGGGTCRHGYCEAH